MPSSARASRENWRKSVHHWWIEVTSFSPWQRSVQNVKLILRKISQLDFADWCQSLNSIALHSNPGYAIDVYVHLCRVPLLQAYQLHSITCETVSQTFFKKRLCGVNRRHILSIEYGPRISLSLKRNNWSFWRICFRPPSSEKRRLSSVTDKFGASNLVHDSNLWST